MTKDSTSLPRFAGRQCMNIASLLAFDIRDFPTLYFGTKIFVLADESLPCSKRAKSAGSVVIDGIAQIHAENGSSSKGRN